MRDAWYIIKDAFGRIVDAGSYTSGDSYGLPTAQLKRGDELHTGERERVADWETSDFERKKKRERIEQLRKELEELDPGPKDNPPSPDQPF